MAPPLSCGAVQEIVTCSFPGFKDEILGAVGTIGLIMKLCETGVAAEYASLPDWVAVILHEPTPFTFTIPIAETVQIDASESVEKETNNPEDEVDVTWNAVSP